MGSHRGSEAMNPECTYKYKAVAEATHGSVAEAEVMLDKWKAEGGVALPYVIEYDIVEGVWVASFEGGEIGRGTLEEVNELCRQAECDGG